MKTLYIVRHAKSSWDDSGLSDFDRPLNDRGWKDAPRMGKRLKEKGVHPNLMVSSPANRALTTCKEMAKVLGYPEEKIQTERSLYHAEEDGIFSVLHQLKDQDHVMIFGHNPGFTEFANVLLDEDIDNVPTCGVVACKLNINQWKEIGPGCGDLLFFDYPKK